MSTVTQSVTNRRSIRAYEDRTVSRELILDILETARRSPSGSNVQPWFVNVLTGPDLDGLRAKIREVIAANPVGEGSEFSIYPKGMGEPYRSRRFKCGEDMYATIGIERDNKVGRLMQFARNFELFDAPVGLFFSIDRAFGHAQWAHLGMFIQTVMLLADERGLATCAQEAWSGMYKTVSTHLDLPDNQMLYCGMALGYPDTNAPINTLVTDRAGVSDFATLRGFTGD